MHSGMLDQIINIRRKVATQDPTTGAESVTWQDDSSIYANARPLRGREFVAMQQLESEIDIIFTIHYRTGITPDARIVWRGDVYEITSPPIDVNARKQWLELNCRTTVNA
jgi:phage head-tail adaptor, putative, SPP1 family